MEYSMPGFINSENDLKIYEDLLKQDLNSTEYGTEAKPQIKSSGIMKEHLNKNIGKLIKVESLIGNRTEIKSGTLMEIGDDYIVLKSRNFCSTVIALQAVKFITVVHNNDRSVLNRI